MLPSSLLELFKAKADSEGAMAHEGKDFESIPILDWNQLETDRASFLGQLRHALVFVGFMYIKNLPVERHVADVKAQTMAFFDLSLEDKLKLEMKNGVSSMSSATRA